jgi:signal transduction histidine kinase
VVGQVVGNQTQIIISDNGPGLNEQQLASIFEKPGRSETGERNGGLGLPLAKQLVEAQGGIFDIQSEAGIGTSVSISFPKS